MPMMHLVVIVPGLGTRAKASFRSLFLLYRGQTQHWSLEKSQSKDCAV